MIEDAESQERISRMTLDRHPIQVHRTEERGESLEQLNATRLAFLEGMKVGTFMLVPGGVACDGNVYSIEHSYQRTLPQTIPIK